MSSVELEENNNESDNEQMNDSDNENEDPPKKLKRRSSIIPFGFIDIEAVESDGEGGDVDNAEDDDGFMSDDHGMYCL